MNILKIVISFIIIIIFNKTLMYYTEVTMYAKYVKKIGFVYILLWRVNNGQELVLGK